MGFVFFLVYVAMSFTRPAERIVELGDWHTIEIAAGLALVGAAFQILTGNRPRFGAAQVPLVFLFAIWLALSVAASPLRSADAFDHVLSFVKSSLTMFLLCVVNLTSLRRVQALAMILTLSAIFLSIEAVQTHNHQVEVMTRTTRGDLQPADAASEWDDESGEPRPQTVNPTDEGRAMNRGLFGDPNDLALSLIAILPFAIAVRRKGAFFRNALFVWIPTVMILYGVYVTRSRGGVLALACVLGLMLRSRLGNAVSLASVGGAVFVLLAAGFVGARSMSIDQSVSERILQWAAGLQMLKSSPVWGVGYDMFLQYATRAAHSAYVQCFAELGIVGYMLWLAILVLTLDDMRLTLACPDEGAEPVRAWSRTLMISLVGFLVGGAFLSRAYDLHLFLLIATGTAIGSIARRKGCELPSRGLLVWTYLIGMLAVGSIVAYWVYMRIRNA